MRERDIHHLFVTYYPALKSFAERLVKSSETAEDIVQDVFLRLWEKPSALEEAKANSAYLYQMVRFKAIDYLRQEKFMDNAIRNYVANLAEEEEEAYLEEEVYRRMDEAIDTLPPGVRSVLTLSLKGHSAKEVAEMLDIAVETVKKQKQIARRMLRERLVKILLIFVH